MKMDKENLYTLSVDAKKFIQRISGTKDMQRNIDKDFRDIEKKVTLIKEIRDEKSVLSTRESELTEPILTDISKIDDIYEIYLDYLADNNLEGNTSNRQKFLFVVLYLYTVGTLAGGKMKEGIRGKLTELMGCTPSLISHNCSNLAFLYAHYSDFKKGVDELMRRVVETMLQDVLLDTTGFHARGYAVRMYDGTTKNVEDVRVGDVLMGDDGTPRNVVSVSRGRGRLIKVKPAKGNQFFVNEGHIMSLYSMKKGAYIEMTILSYYHQPNSYKRTLMLHLDNGELVRFNAYRSRKTDDFFGFNVDANHLYVDYQGIIHHNYGVHNT